MVVVVCSEVTVMLGYVGEQNGEVGKLLWVVDRRGLSMGKAYGPVLY